MEKALTKYGNKLLLFPPQGRILVCTDLHGNLPDFHAMREKFFENIMEEEQTYLLFIGDLIHGPSVVKEKWPDHLGSYYYDQSAELMEQFVLLQEEHPGKVFSLLGNHEHSHIGGPHTCKFHRDEAEYFENSVGPKLALEYKKLFLSFPLVAISQNGLVFTHGAPRASLKKLEDLSRLKYEGYEHLGLNLIIHAPILGEILWSRCASPSETLQFLEATAISSRPNKISIYGHDVVPQGYEKVGKNQIVVSTSFGVVEEKKFYLRLSLEKEYVSLEDWEEGREILLLHGS